MTAWIRSWRARPAQVMALGLVLGGVVYFENRAPDLAMRHAAYSAALHDAPAADVRLKAGEFQERRAILWGGFTCALVFGILYRRAD